MSWRTSRNTSAVRRGLSRQVKSWVRAVDGVSLSFRRGRTFGLVGESGCGKTTLARIILGMEEPTSGVVKYMGEDIYGADTSARAKHRSRVQIVFQDPGSSLNPRIRVKRSILEPVTANTSLTKAQARERVNDMLDLVKLPRASGSLFPHQFSGGQRQRIAIARALASDPHLVILDEPSASLDASIRGQILNLLGDLQEELNLTYLFISHDLSAVRYLAHEIGVMYLGKIVEQGAARDTYAGPLHPYTTALLKSREQTRDPERYSREIAIADVPSPTNIPSGCRFNPRCPHVMDVCREVEPTLMEEASERLVACHLHSSESDDS